MGVLSARCLPGPCSGSQYPPNGTLCIICSVRPSHPVLQLPMPKPAARHRQHSSIGSCHQVIRSLLLPAVQQSASTPDSRPGRNSLAVLPRLALSYSSASRTKPPVGEDSCLHRMQHPCLPMNSEETEKGSGQPVSGAFLGFWIAASLTRSCVLSALSRPQGLSVCLPEPSRYR